MAKADKDNVNTGLYSYCIKLGPQSRIILNVAHLDSVSLFNSDCVDCIRSLRLASCCAAVYWLPVFVAVVTKEISFEMVISWSLSCLIDE